MNLDELRKAVDEGPPRDDHDCWSSDDEGLPEMRGPAKHVDPTEMPQPLPNLDGAGSRLALLMQARQQQQQQQHLHRVCPPTDPLHKRGRLRPAVTGVAIGWERGARIPPREGAEPRQPSQRLGPVQSCDLLSR
mmetsp:Transcript_13852/g.30042  ORF Transcript_13852/g.30042 Transcript_13852/m.30042 type:complete len:134 (-) Transcript_13852:495-896(-)